jgi:putative intracellular protease/amidase
MPKLLMVVSSARTIRLADGSDHPTGYLAEEVLEPYGAFEAAGVDVVFASPEGKVPQPDPWGFEPYFHYPKVDEEDEQSKPGKIGLPWSLESALKNRGAIFDDGDAAWVSHVVIDRNLITAQNPGSTDAAAYAVLKRLTA